MEVKDVNEQELQQAIDSGKPVVVDFWAPWCGPCKMMGPVFKELADEIPDAVFVKVNTDEQQSLAGSYAIRGIPSLVILKDGKEVDRLVGFAPKESLKSKISQAIA